MDKTLFVKTEFLRLVENLNGKEIGNWGLMNAQQMVEHVTDFFKVSSNKKSFPLITPMEQLPKYKEFLLSNKEFRENTKAPMLPKEPAEIRNVSMQLAVDELKNEIENFHLFFKNNAEIKTLHPVFGELNFDEWIQLHFKHTQHHAKQFGLI